MNLIFILIFWTKVAKASLREEYLSWMGLDDQFGHIGKYSTIPGYGYTDTFYYNISYGPKTNVWYPHCQA